MPKTLVVLGVLIMEASLSFVSIRDRVLANIVFNLPFPAFLSQKLRRIVKLKMNEYNFPAVAGIGDVNRALQILAAAAPELRLRVEEVIATIPPTFIRGLTTNLVCIWRSAQIVIKSTQSNISSSPSSSYAPSSISLRR